MKESNLKLAQQDIEEALKAVDDIVNVLDNDDLSKHTLRDKFLALTEKVQELENILKTEGILE